MNLIPDDIVDEEILFPEDFLDQVVEEFSTRFREPKAVVLVHESEDRTALSLALKDGNSGAETLLFQVSHRKSDPYPAAIEPPDMNLPAYLQRQRYAPSLNDAFLGNDVVRSVFSGQTIENSWVCATPAEFREKLRNVLNLDAVKARIMTAIHLARRNARQQAGAS